MSESHQRLTAFGNQLINVHVWLREQLAALRDDAESYLTAGRPRDLRAHCLTFCSAITRHHTGEDTTLFPELAERFPELRPVLHELRRDHEQVEHALRQLAVVLDHAATATDPTRLRAEIDTVAALMETHFQYEERRLVAALNALDLPTWTAVRPAFLLTDDE